MKGELRMNNEQLTSEELYKYEKKYEDIDNAILDLIEKQFVDFLGNLNKLVISIDDTNRDQQVLHFLQTSFVAELAMYSLYISLYKNDKVDEFEEVANVILKRTKKLETALKV